jgi:hypothetical protein
MIKEFYQGKQLLITGVTGFVGKLTGINQKARCSSRRFSSVSMA